MIISYIVNVFHVLIKAWYMFIEYNFAIVCQTLKHTYI